MKKLISIDHLQVGMFLDAEAVGEVKDGVELKYLSAVNAIGGAADAAEQKAERRTLYR